MKNNMHNLLLPMAASSCKIVIKTSIRKVCLCSSSNVTLLYCFKTESDYVPLSYVVV